MKYVIISPLLVAHLKLIQNNVQCKKIKIKNEITLKEKEI